MLGFFVAAGRLEWYQLVGDARKWFDQAFVDFGGQGHLSLTLTDLFGRDSNWQPHLYADSQGIPLLDRFKDYLPKLKYLFVGCHPPDDVDITDSGSRNRDINFNSVAAQIFIDYLRDRNITIPIHWYIAPEPNLNAFGDVDFEVFGEAVMLQYKSYISKFIDIMTNVSADNNLNVPEFLWSPYFAGYPRHDGIRGSIKSRLNRLLTSEPRLRWLHVQDGVGARSMKDSTGTISYSITSEDVIAYYNNILVPAASGTALTSNCINMEFFIFEKGNPPQPLPGDRHEHEVRQHAYRQANVPLGVCFEIAYWYGAKYYRIVPDVIGLDTDLAVSRLWNNGMGLSAEVIGSNLNTKITKQEPLGGAYVHKDTHVKLTAEGPVKVPRVTELNPTKAAEDITDAGLVPRFHPSDAPDPWVYSQDPQPGEVRARGTEVWMTLRGGPIL